MNTTSIRMIQYEKVRDAFRSLMRAKGLVPTMSELNALINEIMASSLRTPLCGQYRFEGYEPIDADAFNTEMALAAADIRTLYAFFNEMQYTTRQYQFVMGVWKQRALSSIRELSGDTARHLSSSFVQGFTKEIDLAGNVDNNATTLLVTEQGSLELKAYTDVNTEYTYTDNDIQIERVGNLSAATIIGDKTTVFNRGKEGGLRLLLEGKETSECGFKITAKTNLAGVNVLNLKLSEDSTGFRLVVEISENRREYTSIFDGVVNHTYISVPISVDEVQAFRITLLRSVPSSMRADRVLYEFSLIRALLVREVHSPSGIYTSMPMLLDDDTTMISLVSEDTEAGSTIKYYISTEVDANGVPSGFILARSNGTSKLLNLYSPLFAHPVRLPSSITMWNLASSMTYGGRLYNLLGQSIDENLGDMSISSNAIVPSSDSSIIQDSIRLFRGTGDYAVKTQQIEHRRRQTRISHPPVVNTAAAWIERIPLRVRVRQLITRIDSTSEYSRNAFWTEHSIVALDDVVIEREDGREIDAIVNSTDNYAKRIILHPVSDDGPILSASFQHYVTYTTTLYEYQRNTGNIISLDESSFTASVEGEHLTRGIDYIVMPAICAIEVQRAGLYKRHYDTIQLDEYGAMLPPYPEIVLSYEYDEMEQRSSSFYETNVFVSAPLDIQILPFGGYEMELGNFHRINGEDVSAMSSFPLPEGWSIIQTTQPHPTLAGDASDVNALTGEPSSAGIVLSGGVEEIRAFSDSLRQVPPMVLAAMEPLEGMKCFSFVNGRIFLNYLPDSISPGLLALQPTLTGKYLLGKKPMYNGVYENTAYEPIAEEFRLEFAYSKTQQPKNVSIRVEITKEEGQGIPFVHRIGLNLFKGV